MKIVTIDDPVLEAQLEELCTANMLDLGEQVAELLNAAVFGDLGKADAEPEVKPKAKAKKSDA